MQLDGVNLLFQTQTISSNRIYSLKYQTSTTLKCKDIGIRKSEFVAETLFLYIQINYDYAALNWLQTLQIKGQK